MEYYWSWNWSHYLFLCDVEEEMLILFIQTKPVHIWGVPSVCWLVTASSKSNTVKKWHRLKNKMNLFENVDKLFKWKEGRIIDEKAGFFDFTTLIEHCSLLGSISFPLGGFSKFKITSLPSSRRQHDCRHNKNTHEKLNGNLGQLWKSHKTR